MYSLLYLLIVIVANMEYIKRIINMATHKSRCNRKYDNAILVTFLEYFVCILVFRYLFCLFLFNGEEGSSTNPFALTAIQLSIQQCKWKAHNWIFIFDACFSNPWIK